MQDITVARELRSRTDSSNPLFAPPEIDVLVPTEAH